MSNGSRAWWYMSCLRLVLYLVIVGLISGCASHVKLLDLDDRLGCNAKELNQDFFDILIEHSVDNHPDLYYVEILVPVSFEGRNFQGLKVYSENNPRMIFYPRTLGERDEDGTLKTGTILFLPREMLQGTMCVMASYSASDKSLDPIGFQAILNNKDQ